MSHLALSFPPFLPHRYLTISYLTLHELTILFSMYTVNTGREEIPPKRKPEEASTVTTNGFTEVRGYQLMIWLDIFWFQLIGPQPVAKSDQIARQFKR